MNRDVSRLLAQDGTLFGPAVDNTLGASCVCFCIRQPQAALAGGSADALAAAVIAFCTATPCPFDNAAYDFSRQARRFMLSKHRSDRRQAK